MLSSGRALRGVFFERIFRYISNIRRVGGGQAKIYRETKRRIKMNCHQSDCHINEDTRNEFAFSMAVLGMVVLVLMTLTLPG